MSKIYTSISQLVGHTPLLELVNFESNNDKGLDLMSGTKGETKTLDAKGIRYEKAGSEGGK